VININSAIRIVKQNIPEGVIKSYVIYKNLYIFIVFTPDLYEGQMDPYYSVDINTGEFRDFPYLQPHIFAEVMALFEKAPKFDSP